MSKPDYNKIGEQDASKGKYNRPHDGPPIIQDLAELIFGTHSGIQKDRDAYDKGHSNTTNQKK